MNQVTEIELVTSIWNSMKYFVHDREDKKEAATQLIELLFDMDISKEDIEAIADEDPLLRSAFSEYCEIEDGDAETSDYDDDDLWGDPDVIDDEDEPWNN